MANLYDVAFQYWAGSNPFNGAAIYADVTIQEIKIHWGVNWADLDEESRQEIRECY